MSQERDLRDLLNVALKNTVTRFFAMVALSGQRAERPVPFDALIGLGAEIREANAICAMIDLTGPVDDLALALAEYREMGGCHAQEVG